jgi:hypothetical protein
MALPLNSVLLSNNNLIIIESLGPQIRAIIKTPTEETLYTGKYTFSATKEVIIQEAIISLYPFGGITIIESNLGTPPPPPSPPPSPQQIEQTRQEESAKAEKQSTQAEQKIVEADLIQDATPEDQKPKGTAKLPSLLFALGSQIPQIIQPSLQELIQKYLPNPDVCPNNITLNELIIQRNNIVQSLNNIGIRINQLSISITGASNFLTIILELITAVEVATLIASTAAKIIPITPGAVPAALNDAQTLIRKITFDKLGNSKLSKIQGIISSSALVISIIGTYILTVKGLINIIDAYINKCQLNPNIIPTSDIINAIADAQLQASQTSNQITYKGFIIEIEEVLFNDIITRRKAVGKNLQGIPLVETELSFTTNSQILINELKLIIDRDNLKAY